MDRVGRAVLVLRNSSPVMVRGFVVVAAQLADRGRSLKCVLFTTGSRLNRRVARVNPRVPELPARGHVGRVRGRGGRRALLLTTPKWGGSEVWAWITPPFNARYVGVIYLAALVPLVIFAVSGRWSPGRLVLWEIFVFTAAIMVVMFAYAGRFEWARVATWVFWPLYFFLPVNSAVFLWRLRDWKVPDR